MLSPTSPSCSETACPPEQVTQSFGHLPVHVPVPVNVPEIPGENASGKGTGTGTFTGRGDFSDEN